jgi:hypothetical protein
MGQALKDPSQWQSAIERAKSLVSEAMAELDAVGAPGDIAAHLDLAVHRMTIVLNQQ